VLSGEETNTNCIVFGLNRSGLESTIYPTLGEHANNETTDTVLRGNSTELYDKCILIKCSRYICTIIRDKGRYNWNTVEKGVEHHNPNPIPVQMWRIVSAVEQAQNES